MIIWKINNLFRMLLQYCISARTRKTKNNEICKNWETNDKRHISKLCSYQRFRGATLRTSNNKKTFLFKAVDLKISNNFHYKPRFT
jgi:hypothetical protein